MILWPAACYKEVLLGLLLLQLRNLITRHSPIVRLFKILRRYWFHVCGAVVRCPCIIAGIWLWSWVRSYANNYCTLPRIPIIGRWHNTTLVHDVLWKNCTNHSRRNKRNCLHAEMHAWHVSGLESRFCYAVGFAVTWTCTLAHASHVTVISSRLV